MRYTLKEVTAELKALGMTIRKSDGEYCVNVKGGNEATAYYTNVLADALYTGKRMAETRDARKAENTKRLNNVMSKMRTRGFDISTDVASARIQRLIDQGYHFEPMMLHVLVTSSDYRYILGNMGNAFEENITQDFEYAARCLLAYNAANPERYHS